MAILKDSEFTDSLCEVEFQVDKIDPSTDGDSIYLTVCFRYGTKFPELSARVCCLKDDLLLVCSKLEDLPTSVPHILSTNDPGITIYELPYEGTLYRLVFVLDAGEINNYVSTDSGPAIYLRVTENETNKFVTQLKKEIESVEHSN